MVDIGATLEKFGGILATTFGEKILVGIIVQLFADATPGDCYQCIVKNKTIAQIGEEDWSKYQGYAKKAKLRLMNMDKVMALLEKRMQHVRPDLYSIIINTPGGWKWLNAQIDGIREKLGI